jgi:hypothetical protein
MFLKSARQLGEVMREPSFEGYFVYSWAPAATGLPVFTVVGRLQMDMRHEGKSD